MSLIAVPIVNSFPRRTLMFVGLVGQIVGLILAATPLLMPQVAGGWVMVAGVLFFVVKCARRRVPSHRSVLISLSQLRLLLRPAVLGHHQRGVPAGGPRQGRGRSHRRQLDGAIKNVLNASPQNSRLLSPQGNYILALAFPVAIAGGAKNGLPFVSTQRRVGWAYVGACRSSQPFASPHF